MFLDCLRNACGQNAVAPYAVRALETAPVANPLDWDEVTSGHLDPRAYTIDNLFRRLGQKAEPWRHIDQHRCTLDTACSRLRALNERR